MFYANRDSERKFQHAFWW